MEPVILSGDEGDLFVQRHAAYDFRRAVLVPLGDDIRLRECEGCRQKRRCREYNLFHGMSDFKIFLDVLPPVVRPGEGFQFGNQGFLLVGKELNQHLALAVLIEDHLQVGGECA